MIRVLSVASECAPLVKTGGLADVVGALPAALTTQGVDMRVLLPGYPAVRAAAADFDCVFEMPDLFGGPARLLAGQAAGLQLFVLAAPHLYDRDGGPYLDANGQDWADNDARFAALSWMGAQIGAEGAGGWQPDVVHAHDWQAGLTPVYLKARGVDLPTVMTVHNIAFHGVMPAERMADLALPDWAFHPDGMEYYGQASALKAGLMYAWKVTTVSPTYARELTTPEFGEGLDGVIRARGADVTGILNGIDEAAWNPAADPNIAAFKVPRGKVKTRRALLDELGLPEGDGPLCVVVSRMTAQKGLDLLLEALPGLLARGGRLALLGSGEPALEEAWRAADARHEGVAVRIGYDEAMSHRLIAGGDAILVPSRFEPCGLTQLYGLRYGTVPVVARTGGLADTVIDANPAALAAGVATGIQFAPVTAGALAMALDRLCDLHAQPTLFARMQRNGMRAPVGWGDSAAVYAALYAGMLPET
ncbi:glycogen synthase GlgA [Rhodovulum adriaticum]|uniref:Glycogen synthase n=1 Tax=Rhodovulum adriaticum TaxID=35804 RepID=A0A4R2NJX7_RHOAD|nr:glycogen synthase GlgA [Rhodovulum adriaticum]MBK1636768.1 starch synthase [Rhodovulum adriaticum]TCP21751.1 starch synthase [Rhodovulum adriaticum]